MLFSRSLKLYPLDLADKQTVFCLFFYLLLVFLFDSFLSYAEELICTPGAVSAEEEEELSSTAVTATATVFLPMDSMM